MVIIGPGFYSSIMEYKALRESTAKFGHLTDIHDGSQYKEALTLLLNTDGVVLFRSTSHSLWPVLLMINELPFSER